MIDGIDERSVRKVIDLEEEMKHRGSLPQAGQLENIEFPRELKLPEAVKKDDDTPENEANE